MAFFLLLVINSLNISERNLSTKPCRKQGPARFLLETSAHGPNKSGLGLRSISATVAVETLLVVITCVAGVPTLLFMLRGNVRY